MGSNATPLSFLVATTLAAQRIVTASTSTANTVIFPATNQDLPLGISVDTVLETTGSIPIAISGIAKLFFNDTVPSGMLVQSDSSGRGVPFTLADTTTALTLASAYVGTLIGASVVTTATIADVLINPGFDRE